MIELKFVEADQGLDWLQFIAAIVGAIAWPVAAVALAFMFRRQIGAILDKIRRVSLGDAEFDLSEKLTEIEAVANRPPPPPFLAEEPPGASEETTSNTPATDTGKAPAAKGDLTIEEVRKAQPQPTKMPSPDQAARRRYAGQFLKGLDFAHVGNNGFGRIHQASIIASIVSDWDGVMDGLIELNGSDGFIWGRADNVPFEVLLGTLMGRGKITPRQYAMLRELYEVRQAAERNEVSELDALRFGNLAKQILAELTFIR